VGQGRNGPTSARSLNSVNSAALFLNMAEAINFILLTRQKTYPINRFVGISTKARRLNCSTIFPPLWGQSTVGHQTVATSLACSNAQLAWSFACLDCYRIHTVYQNLAFFYGWLAASHFKTGFAGKLKRYLTGLYCLNIKFQSVVTQTSLFCHPIDLRRFIWV